MDLDIHRMANVKKHRRRPKESQGTPLRRTLPTIAVMGSLGNNKDTHASPISRLLEIGPTIRVPGVYCKSCEEGISKHSKGCKDQLDKTYKDVAGSEAGRRLATGCFGKGGSRRRFRRRRDFRRFRRRRRRFRPAF